MIGCGSIGRAVLPLLLRHVVTAPDRIVIVTADERGRSAAEKYGVTYHVTPLDRSNYREVISPLLGRGDFLLNLSVEVESLSLIRLAREQGALYLDTCIEPWAGGYTDQSKSASERSNYGLRHAALELGRSLGPGPTAVVAQGANPGLVSQLVKEALLQMAAETGLQHSKPSGQAEWAALVRDLGIKAIHIAERDTQVAAGHPKKPGEFVNTWSIDGFIGEGCQPAELGWGTHEKTLPAEGHQHGYGSDAAIYLARPGASTRVRSWTPLAGPYHGFLITHNEAISIADYFTSRDGQTVTWRPTVHYAYHPADDAVLSVHELAGRNWEEQPEKRLMMDEITSGIDELGVLLMGNPRGVFWYGSRLSIEEARELAPFNSATSLQVAAGVLGGMAAAIEHPDAGLVEADQLDHERVMELARPYLGPVVGVWGDWTPLEGRGRLFPEDLNTSDPWQFKNILVR
ncbi:homospermidine synthase [Geminicoccus sp.]|uniref:homospermidine synthase n=1 Tax=Geminicoccus sp. TaxID=2024832 RepID=UPI0032C211D0